MREVKDGCSRGEKSHDSECGLAWLGWGDFVSDYSPNVKSTKTAGEKGTALNLSNNTNVLCGRQDVRSMDLGGWERDGRRETRERRKKKR